MCADTLRSHVLPRLRLADLQALSQTCRAWRATIRESDAELQDLALVGLRTLSSANGSSPDTVLLVQAHVPRGHLGSQAAPRATALEQLNGLARQHARVRLGRPSLAGELRLHADELQLQPGAEICAHHTRQSLASRHAVVPWFCDDDETSGVLVAGRDVNGAAWICEQPAAGGLICGGHCNRGRFCATMSLRDTAHGEHRFVACAFSNRCRRWQPEIELHRCKQCERDDVGESVKLSACSKPLLAAALGRIGGQATLLVADLTQRSGFVVPVAGATAFRWAPGSHAVLLLKPGGLARLNLHPRPVSVSWVSPFPAAAHGKPCMVLAPGSGHRTLWVAHLLAASKTATCVSLAAIDPGDLSVLSTRELEVTGREGRPCGLDASRRALALGFMRCTCVYGLSGQQAVGPFLFRAEGLAHGRFSPDGCFLAGLLYVLDIPTRVAVLDARCGSCLATVAASDLGPLSGRRLRLDILSAGWCRGGQLLVKCAVEAPEQDGKDDHPVARNEDTYTLGVLRSELRF